MTNSSRRGFLGSLAAAARAGERPHVMVFLSDQESALLPGPVKLPHRRRLMEGGVEFTQAFCNTPQCSPARAALLTGLEPHRSGVLTNVDGGSLGKPLPASLPTVGSVFREAGYQTGYFGKWHLGGDASGFSTYVPGQDEVVAKEAAQWIRTRRGPWLAWVSILNPHHIYDLPKLVDRVLPRPGVRPPATGLENLKGKPSEQQQFVDQDQGQATRHFTRDEWIRYRSYYCELVEKADACLGTVLQALPDLGSVIAVYTTDHGDALGEHGLPFKGPFMYEELVRIPLVIATPAWRSGRRQDLVTQADLAPTLAALAGLKWPGAISGLDLTRQREARDAVFLEYYAKQKWVNPIRTIRTRKWKLNWYDRGNRELYDLEQDPQETVNRAEERGAAGVRRELEARLNAWRGPIS